MKIFKRFINIFLMSIVTLTLISAVGSAVLKKPVLLTVIRSNSMYPIWQRGDLLVIQNLSKSGPVHIGDMIIFKSKEGDLSHQGWIAHRIVGGNEKKGYVTKGDANHETDQASGESSLIRRDWIVGKVMTIKNHPLVIPKLGYLSLWLENLSTKPFWLPSIAVILAFIFLFSEWRPKKGVKRKGKNGMDLPLIYMAGGLTLSIVVASSMITTSQQLNINYKIGDSEGALMGSTVGVLEVGQTRTNNLSKFSNHGFLPLVGTIRTKDGQITFSQRNFYLKPGEQVNTTFTVLAKHKGDYQSHVSIGLFYPFLPAGLIYKLASLNYWFALIMVSLIPGLPLMSYPFIDGRMRQKIYKFCRKKIHRIQRKVIRI